MVSDGLATAGDTIISRNTKKVFNINGYLVGGAGSLTEINNFVSWFTEYTNAEVANDKDHTLSINYPEPYDNSNFLALVLTPEGSLHYYEGGINNFEIANPFAIGSGANYAIAAMKAGADITTAMEVAIDMDCFTGGEVYLVELPIQIEEEEELQPKEVEEIKEVHKMYKVLDNIIYSGGMEDV